MPHIQPAVHSPDNLLDLGMQSDEKVKHYKKATKPSNCGHRNRASFLKCKISNQKALIVATTKKTIHTIEKIRRQGAPDVPLHGADESRKATDA